MNVGNFYKFRYNGRVRFVVVLEKNPWNQNVTCWDFTCQGYRTFALSLCRDIEQLKGFTTDRTDYKFANPKVKSKNHNGTLYGLVVEPNFCVN